jgi:hypothetical protein
MIKTPEHKKTNCCFSSFTDGTKQSSLLTFQRKKKRCQGTQHPQENVICICATGWLDRWKWNDVAARQTRSEHLGGMKKKPSFFFNRLSPKHQSVKP